MRARILALDALDVFVDQPEKVHLLLPGADETHVVERIDEADVLKGHVLAHLLAVGVLDVEAGDIVGQDGDLVAVDLVPVLAGHLRGRQVFDQLGDKGAGADDGIEDWHVGVAE